MQVVINIDKDLYEMCRDSLGNEDNIEGIIAKGTPLPKGHGGLGDLDRLRSKIFNASIDEHFMPVKSLTCDDVTDIIDDAPTIIEADTESEVQP